MARYIDEEHLWTRLRIICDLNCPYSEKQRDVMCGACLLGSAFDTVDSEKTVDAEPVIRCKDCKFMEIEQGGKYLVARCPFRKQILNPSGFCDLAERRE